jgi:hypothetical protein
MHAVFHLEDSTVTQISRAYITTVPHARQYTNVTLLTIPTSKHARTFEQSVHPYRYAGRLQWVY